MQLNIKALAITGGSIFGVCTLFVGFLNLVTGTYAAGFLEGLTSLYPFVEWVNPGIVPLIITTVFAFIDGAITGFLVGWIYNGLVVASSEAE